MTTPDVKARETRKPTFPATVHAYTDALQTLRDGPMTAEAMAQATDRQASNVRRDVHKLRDAAVIELHVMEGGVEAWRLTDKGRRWVEGVDVAEGRAQPGGGEPTARYDKLHADPDQPRKSFTEAELTDLTLSIREKGLLQPIVVRPDVQDDFLIVAGERRWRAIGRLIGSGHWPAERPIPIRLASPADEAEVMELALIENTQRADLNHMELAQGYRRLQDLGRTPKQIAAAVGRHNDHVTQHIRLTNLPAELHPLVADGRITFHDAKDLEAAIRALRDAGAACDAATIDGIKSGELSPRGAVEQLRQAVKPTADWPEWVKARHKLVLLEVADKCIRERAHDGHGLTTLCGESYPDPTGTVTADMIGLGLHFGFGGGKPNYVGIHEEACHLLEAEGLLTADGAVRDKLMALRGEVAVVGAKGFHTGARYWTPWLDAGSHTSAPTGPHVVNGVDYFNASRAQEARYAAGIDKRPEPNHGGRSAQPPAADNAEPTKAQLVDEGVTLSGRARLALVELAHKIAVDRRFVDPAAEVAWNPHDLTSYSAFAADIGTYWTDSAHAELAAQGLAVFATVKGGLPPMASLTPKGADWLDAQLRDGLPVSQTDLVTARCDMRKAQYAFATPWLAEVAQPATESAPAAQPAARLQGDLDDDPWGRSRDQIDADAEALREVQNLEAMGFVPGGLADLDAFHTRGVTQVQVRDSYLDLCGPEGQVVASVVVDPNQDLPDSRGDALTLLVARALTRVVTGAGQ